MYRIRTTPFAQHSKAGSSFPSHGEGRLSQSAGVARVEALARAGFTSERLGLPERAIGLYRKALEELPGFTPPSRWELAVPVKHNLALLLAARGLLCEAVIQLEGALALLSAEDSLEASATHKRVAWTLDELSKVESKD